MQVTELLILRYCSPAHSENASLIGLPSWSLWRLRSAGWWKNRTALTRRRPTPSGRGSGRVNRRRRQGKATRSCREEDAVDRKWFRRIWSSKRRRITWRLLIPAKDGRSSFSSGERWWWPLIGRWWWPLIGWWWWPLIGIWFADGSNDGLWLVSCIFSGLSMLIWFLDASTPIYERFSPSVHPENVFSMSRLWEK